MKTWENSLLKACVSWAAGLSEMVTLEPVHVGQEKEHGYVLGSRSQYSVPFNIKRKESFDNFS